MGSDTTRRSFLRSSAGVVALEPMLIGAGAQSGGGEKTRFAMIGVGMEGSGVMRTALGLPGVECVGAADLYDGRHILAKSIAGNPNLPTTRRYQELLDRKDVDCVLAAVPDHWHKRVVVDCCNAGKDVYCEKPMSHTAHEGFAMV